MVNLNNMNCPFCNIVNNEPERIIEEKENVVVLLSNPRLMYGHTLVIPKRHVEKPSQLSKEESNELWETVVEYQEKILDKIAPGCDIRQHYRPFIGQSATKVNHLHVHLQPRENEDELYEKAQIHHEEIFEDLSDEDRKELKQKLKS